MKEKKNIPNIFAIFLGFNIVLITFCKTLLILDFLLLTAGAALIITNITTNSNLQKSSGDRVRGKVVSLFHGPPKRNFSGKPNDGNCFLKLGIMLVLVFNGILALLIQIYLLDFNKKF